MGKDIQELGFCLVSLLKKMQLTKKERIQLSSQTALDMYIDNNLGKKYNPTLLMLLKFMCRPKIELIPSAVTLRRQVECIDEAKDK